ncbi:hypothetical protein J132_06537 [Termitomyces sp. J132]|nr:hypothetical protein J132_06537 [Termitomyces sp. J132]
MSEASAELTAKAKTYSKALKTTPEGNTPFERNTNIDPRLRAREAVRQRQVLIDLDQPGEDRERMMNMLITGLTSKLNDQLGLIKGYNNYMIKALARMTNGGILLEMSNKEGAAWVKNRSREIEGAIGGGAKIKKRTYPIIIKFVPITLDPESTEEREAIKEASDLSRGAITSLRWIKPIKDRRKGQRVGHLIAKFSNENDANKATTTGLYIHHTRVMAEKQVSGSADPGGSAALGESLLGGRDPLALVTEHSKTFRALVACAGSWGDVIQTDPGRSGEVRL